MVIAQLEHLEPLYEQKLQHSQLHNKLSAVQDCVQGSHSADSRACNSLSTQYITKTCVAQPKLPDS